MSNLHSISEGKLTSQLPYYQIPTNELLLLTNDVSDGNVIRQPELLSDVHKLPVSEKIEKFLTVRSLARPLKR